MNDSGQAELLERCKTGDESAFRLLAERYTKLLLGTAHLMSHDRDLAQDALQNTLLKMWQHLPDLRADGLKAWLVKVMIHEVQHQHRKNRTPLPDAAQGLEMAEQPLEAAAAAVRSEERLELRQALDTLPQEQREAVILKYFAGLTIAEIAAAVNCREGTVKSRLHRALECLGKVLKSDSISFTIPSLKTYPGQYPELARVDNKSSEKT